MTKPVILTGLRANSDLTIGNYFGAILPMVDMAQKHADDYQLNMFIPDLHSFTTPINHDDLFQRSLQNARVYAAAGLPLNNDNVHLYRQSFVSAHSELTWILSCFTGMGEMNRMTQFKDKSQKLGHDQISVGLFNYPILMASDILIYNSSYIPVGEDQTQHVEFARDIATRMNNRFGELFVVPKSVPEQHKFFGKDQGLRIMDLQNPTKKMSKSDDSGKGVIFLNDSPKTAAKKIMSAATDDLALINYDKTNQPGISNLLDILALLRNQTIQAVTDEFQGQTQYGNFKRQVATELSEFLADFQAKLNQINDNEINNKLQLSESAMNQQANATLLRVQQAIGLRPKGTK